MHIKKRGNTLSLYRSVWVPKGTRGNTHGFSQQKFVASLPEGSTDIPAHVRDLLTQHETQFVEQSICAPARAAQAEARVATALRLAGLNAWKLPFNVIGMRARSHTLERKVERQYALLAQSKNSSYCHVTPLGG